MSKKIKKYIALIVATANLIYTIADKDYSFGLLLSAIIFFALSILYFFDVKY